MSHNAIINMPYLVSWIGVFAIAALDRFCLKRGKPKIIDVSDLQQNGGYFSVRFRSNLKYKKYRLKYELIDNTHPISVRYVGEISSIPTTSNGETQEIIQIANKLPPIKTMALKIELTACRTSFFNPFYKICPIQTAYSGVIQIV